MKPMSAVLLAALALGATPAASQEPFRIEVNSNLDGPAVGRGIELALAEINATGGVLGRTLEVQYASEPCDHPAGAAPPVQVSIVIGGFCTKPHEGVPLLIANAATPSLVGGSHAGLNDWSSQITPPPEGLAEGFIGYLKQQNAKKIALIGDDDPPSRATAELFAGAIKAAGIELTTTEFIPLGATDFAPLLVRLMAAAPDHVVVSRLDHSVSGFFSHYELFDWRVPVAGCFDLAAARDAVTEQFLAAGGMQGVASLQIFSTALKAQPAAAFVGEYVERFDAQPDERAFYAYQAIYLVADALRRAASDAAPDILAALRSTTMPAMSGGSFAFDPHHVAHPDAVVSGIRDGHIIVMALLKT